MWKSGGGDLEGYGRHDMTVDAQMFFERCARGDKRRCGGVRVWLRADDDGGRCGDGGRSEPGANG